MYINMFPDIRYLSFELLSSLSPVRIKHLDTQIYRKLCFHPWSRKESTSSLIENTGTDQMTFCPLGH